MNYFKINQYFEFFYRFVESQIEFTFNFLNLEVITWVTFGLKRQTSRVQKHDMINVYFKDGTIATIEDAVKIGKSDPTIDTSVLGGTDDVYLLKSTMNGTKAEVIVRKTISTVDINDINLGEGLYEVLIYYSSGNQINHKIALNITKNIILSAFQLCDFTCKKCVGHTKNNCTICTPGFYLNTTEKLCLKCHNNCVECNGPSSNQCTKCPENGIPLFGKCYSIIFLLFISLIIILFIFIMKILII